MTTSHGRVTESEVGLATLQVAANRPNGVATFHRLRKEIPHYLSLSSADRKQSVTRPNEELWEQQIRNIRCHQTASGNIIHEGYVEHVPRVGYRITKLGRHYLNDNGF